MGEELTRWTIRVALALSFAALATRFVAGQHSRGARLLWTFAWAAYLFHVGCAFQFFHGWSHAEAYRHTADQTYATTGWRWGGGLFFNYAFTLFWTLDVSAIWLAGGGTRARARKPRARKPRARKLGALWLGFFLFMVFNAAVVFEQGPTRWSALVGFAILAICWWATERPRGENTSENAP